MRNLKPYQIYPSKVSLVDKYVDGFHLSVVVIFLTSELQGERVSEIIKMRRKICIPREPCNVVTVTISHFLNRRNSGISSISIQQYK